MPDAVEKSRRFRPLYAYVATDVKGNWYFGHFRPTDYEKIVPEITAKFAARDIDIESCKASRVTHETLKFDTFKTESPQKLASKVVIQPTTTDEQSKLKDRSELTTYLKLRRDIVLQQLEAEEQTADMRARQYLRGVLFAFDEALKAAESIGGT